MPDGIAVRSHYAPDGDAHESVWVLSGINDVLRTLFNFRFRYASALWDVSGITRTVLFLPTIALCIKPTRDALFILIIVNINIYPRMMRLYIVYICANLLL